MSAPAPASPDDVLSGARHELVQLFQAEVIRAGLSPADLSLAVDASPRAVTAALRGERMLPWFFYQRVLTECDSSPQIRNRIHWLYRVLQGAEDLPLQRDGRVLRRHNRTREFRRGDGPDYPPFIADTPAEFVALLRKIMLSAGLNPGQITTKTSIGRSQAYNMVKVGRTGLPTKLNQVREFVTACGLSEHQVRRVVRLWIELKETPRKPVAAEPSVANSESAEMVQAFNGLVETQMKTASPTNHHRWVSWTLTAASLFAVLSLMLAVSTIFVETNEAVRDVSAMLVPAMVALAVMVLAGTAVGSTSKIIRLVRAVRSVMLPRHQPGRPRTEDSHVDRTP